MYTAKIPILQAAAPYILAVVKRALFPFLYAAINLGFNNKTDPTNNSNNPTTIINIFILTIFIKYKLIKK